jgi:PPOX class probable F420-dependent enzyme
MLTAAALEALAEHHLGTLSTLGRHDRIHAVPVGFTYEAGVVRIIGSRGSQKFLNAERSGRGAVCSVDRARWISFEGPAMVLENADAVAHAVALYSARYRPPRSNPQRVVLELHVERVLGSQGFRTVTG